MPLPIKRKRRAQSRPSKSRPAPRRQGEGQANLAELKRQGALLFRGLLPLGPEAFELLRTAESKFGPPANRDAPRPPVLDLLLRLSETVGTDSGYARILRGAAAVFARNGVEETRIEDILDAAQVSARTYYQFFRNKNEVLDALYDLFISVWISAAEQELSREGNPRARLRRFGRTFVGAMAVAGRLARVVIAESFRPGTSVAKRYEGVQGQLIEWLLPIYAELGIAGLDEQWIRSRLAAAQGMALALPVVPQSSRSELEAAEAQFLEILLPVAVER